MKIVFLLLALTTSFSLAAKTETAILAGGCFWCLEPPFDALKEKGVIETVVGYTGGTTTNPTYKQISDGTTGHKEVIQVTFDNTKISYEQILEVFWKNIDPYDDKGQFCDKGNQYSSAVYYLDESQKLAYQNSLRKIETQKTSHGRVKTELIAASTFYPAEDYHQDYYLKNPLRYKYYRNGCGRDKRLKEIWQD